MWPAQWSHTTRVHVLLLTSRFTGTHPAANSLPFLLSSPTRNPSRRSSPTAVARRPMPMRCEPVMAAASRRVACPCRRRSAPRTPTPTSGDRCPMPPSSTLRQSLHCRRHGRPPPVTTAASRRAARP
ncbi:hypothetical protein VPH35_121743 [Triticum aestivum]